MPAIINYLSFNGNCAEAMRFYERALGGKLEALMTNAETPAGAEVPPGNEDRIMHAYLKIPGGELMAGDSMVGEKYEGMKGFGLTITYPTAEEGKRVFETLSEGGKIGWKYDKVFWAEGSGMVTDRFGTPWIINGGPLMGPNS